MAIITTIENCDLRLASGKTTSFRFPIGNAIEFADIVVVRLQVPRGEIFNENVYGVDREGNIVWQVQPEYPPNWDAAWGGLEREGDQAVLSNSESQIRYLEPKTGKIIKRGMSVR